MVLDVEWRMTKAFTASRKLFVFDCRISPAKDGSRFATPQSCAARKAHDLEEQTVRKVLIADDDKDMLGLLTTLLELEGDDVVSVTKPPQVLPTAREQQPDIILMDVHLSGGDTLDTLKSLKQDPELQGIPVLMASGTDMKRECLRLGAEGFILKPFRPSELLDYLNKLANGS
jgi:CheY-like chemotaxis protein